MKLKNALTTIVVLLSMGLFAQVAPGSRILSCPDGYDRPDGDLLPENSKGENDWVVFADRENVQTYSDPDGRNKLMTLNFLDFGYVIAEHGEFLHMVKFDLSIFADNATPTNRFIKTSAIDWGWVDKKKLLLWNHALVSKRQGFTIKALTISTDPNALANPELYVKNGNVVRLYDTPGGVTENRNGITLFQFLYIYKKSDDGAYYLIGKSLEFEKTTVKSQILGWAPKGIIHLWDQRLCIEPNYDPLAANERKETELKARLFNDPNEVKAVRRGYNISPSWNDDPYSNRRDATWKRFPVLNAPKDKDSILETGLITEIVDKNSDTTITKEEQMRTERSYNEQRRNARMINIVFVMDGGNNMKGFYEPIINSIKSTIKLTQDDRLNKFSYGGVIYRDYSEEKCLQKRRDFETTDINSDPNDLIQFFSVASLETRDCYDTEKPQAVYLGLDKALRMFENHPKQTNIIILIGNTGNREQDKMAPTNDEIAKRLAATGTALLAYQVQNAKDDNYLHFILQSTDLIEKSAKIIVENARKTKRGESMPASDFKKDAAKNIYYLNYPELSPIPGRLIFAESGNQMPIIDLETNIAKLIEEVRNNVEVVLADIDSKISGVGKRGRKLSAGALYVLSQQSDSINEEIIKKYTGTNYQFFMKAYTAMWMDEGKLHYPLFKYSLFVDEYEYDDLISSLKKFVNAGTGSKTRENLRQVYMDLALKYLGGDSKEALNTHLNEVMEKLTGMPSRSAFLKSHSIEDLENRGNIKESTLNLIQEDMGRVLSKLMSIKSSSKYSFENNDIRFYWIPEDLLP